MSNSAVARRDEMVPIGSGWESSAASAAMVPTEAGAVSAVAREEAEIKAAIILARNFPRDEATAYARIMKSCQRPAFAEAAAYSFPRGGAAVEGPSVDLAREMARCWGNIRFGLRVVSVDKDMVHIKGYALDLETNNYIEAEDKFAKLVQRKRSGRTEWVEPDERDLRELVNRRGAILVRNCILQILPPDVTEDALRVAKETMRRAAAGEIQQNKQDAIRRLVMAFDGIGVSPEMIAGYLGHDISLITEDEIVALRQIYKSIADGNSRREEYFEFKRTAAPDAVVEDLNAKIRQGGGRAKSAEPRKVSEVIAEEEEQDQDELFGKED